MSNVQEVKQKLKKIGYLGWLEKVFYKGYCTLLSRNSCRGFPALRSFARVAPWQGEEERGEQDDNDIGSHIDPGQKKYKQVDEWTIEILPADDHDILRVCTFSYQSLPACSTASEQIEADR